MSKKPATQKSTTKELTLKEAFEELESITEALERGDIDLEKSIPQLKRGHELATFLKKKLQTIENDIEEISTSFEDHDE
jgi:exodeoxyribonuclease VII small subunit